jgi:ribosome-interacting GTPase 1
MVHMLPLNGLQGHSTCWHSALNVCRELEAVGMRLNRSPPAIYFKRKKTGGVSINSTLTLTKMDDRMVFRVLQEYKIHNCEVGGWP